MMEAELTIKQAQLDVDQWIKTVGVRYFNELTNLGILMEEVGELSRLMVRKYGEQSFKEIDKGKELGDENSASAPNDDQNDESSRVPSLVVSSGFSHENPRIDFDRVLTVDDIVYFEVIQCHSFAY